MAKNEATSKSQQRLEKISGSLLIILQLNTHAPRVRLRADLSLSASDLACSCNGLPNRRASRPAEFRSHPFQVIKVEHGERLASSSRTGVPLARGRLVWPVAMAWGLVDRKYKGQGLVSQSPGHRVGASPGCPRASSEAIHMPQQKRVKRPLPANLLERGGIVGGQHFGDGKPTLSRGFRPRF